MNPSISDKSTDLGPVRPEQFMAAAASEHDRSCRALARIVNSAMTAQVQFAYACATAAAEQALRSADYVETTWPDTVLRALVAATYKAQARESQEAARRILRRARQRCGLAFARLT